MSDLISRQTVLARVRLNYTNHQTIERHEIEDIIKSEPSAENKGEWIPVSERLPEEGETVLVCYQTQGGIAQSVCEWFDMPNRGIVWSTLGGRNPIAWQPLPEPYKAGENNEYCSECECKEECDGIEYMSKDQCEKKRGWQ